MTMERLTGIEPALQPWEGCVLPEHFSRVIYRANDGLRSRDLDVGNVALYRLSYVRILL